jgi:L-ascorbate metabolism protein UlaG (beta-lactamase superfamily)
MRMIKYTHACVRLIDGDRSLLIDPGTWAEDSAFENATDVLVTHEHADHIDVERLVALHGKNPDLRVYVPTPVAEQLSRAAPSFASAVNVVAVGDTFTAAGFAVHAVGGKHAVIYDGIPDTANIGYVVNGAVYHPGDSTFVPDVAVDTLLVPTAAPWLKLAEAIDFIRAVRPARAYSIHDAMLSDKGEMGVDRWLAGEGETEYGRITPGDSVEL